MNRFCPYPELNGSQLKEHSAAVVEGVRTEADIPQIHTRFSMDRPWAVHFQHSTLSAPKRKVPTTTTPVAGTNYPFYSPPGQTNM